MPDYRHILLDKDASDHIAKITLNRPERLNALNDVMIDEIGDAVENVSGDDSMRVLILTGAGRALGSISKAAEMLFTGDFLETEEAQHLGFLSELVPQEDLENTTMEMARKIAAGPPVAIRLSKLMLYKGLEFDLDTAMKMAAAAETITLTSRDHAEGTAAIRESRKPAYEGR